ncbi:hypothetical protein WAF17_04960 [Bernardetia sp. ABR2-2B]|uniref:hypothetical protein n=1 Tax=Bernardetia sp. ABR2-2B TaxID=3127472 RepID=UPI0030CF67A2
MKFMWGQSTLCPFFMYFNLIKVSDKKEDDWSNILLVNLACLVAGLIISILLEWRLFGLSWILFTISTVNYVISSRATKNYLAWDRMGLFCLIASFITFILAFLNLLSDLH